MPTYSVIIPSYNHAAYIGKAVQSVLDQTRPDLELIVIDDGSSDNSLEVLRGFNDRRMQVISQANQGAHAAINRGLHLAQGDTLAILNSDDVYHPRRFETLLPLFEANPNLGLAASHIEVIDAQGKALAVKHGYADLSPWPLAEPQKAFRSTDDWRGALLCENYLSTTSNYVFPRRVWQTVGDFAPLRYAHDWDFALRLTGSYDLHLETQPLLQYRVHGSNTIRENRAAMLFEICWCLAVHAPRQADSAWFGQAPRAQRLEQLLHSIEVAGMERVLAVMLLERLAENPQRAQALLDPASPERQRYLEFIRAALPAETTPPPPAPRSLLQKILDRIRSI
ncbi:MAG TPA: glycosyltransferase [Anaerolineaceae bacterium]|nr:glycosyltransferase [Anaerolineaceae bacterium]HPN52298.1 glycosyltransferase [Anaerolineaceae bacterium]